MQTPPAARINPDPIAQRHSPCVGVCQLDAATGWCRGCGRSGDEVAAWLGFNDDQRLAVWEKLPQRLDQLDVHVRLLPLTRSEIGSWAEATLKQGNGTWVTGAPGALAEFPVGDHCRPEVSASPEAIEARLPSGRLRLSLHDKLRAFGFGRLSGAVVLALPKARATLAVAQTLTALGADAQAIGAEHRADLLFDFGIGRRASRFCVRTADADLTSALTALAGQPWAAVLGEAGALILAKNPHRVVESALARIEVFAPIPAGDAVSPEGAHTHFLPQHLQQGGEAPAEFTLPDFALPVAILYPRAL